MARGRTGQLLLHEPSEAVSTMTLVLPRSAETILTTKLPASDDTVWRLYPEPGGVLLAGALATTGAMAAVTLPFSVAMSFVRVSILALAEE